MSAGFILILRWSGKRRNHWRRGETSHWLNNAHNPELPFWKLCFYPCLLCHLVGNRFKEAICSRACNIQDVCNILVTVEGRAWNVSDQNSHGKESSHHQVKSDRTLPISPLLSPNTVEIRAQKVIAADYSGIWSIQIKQRQVHTGSEWLIHQPHFIHTHAQSNSPNSPVTE